MQTAAEHTRPIGFVEQTTTADAALRRERRPLPAHDLSGCNYRKWAAAVLSAELKHARTDFWRAVHDLGLMLDRDGADRDADVGYRFEHERLAGVALEWLGALNMHEGDRSGPWALWMHWNETQRRAWRIGWVKRARGFLRAMRAYKAARSTIDQPAVRSAA